MSGELPRSGVFRKVTSLANPLVKELRALHQKNHRDETGLFIAEGQKLVRDAVEWQRADHSVRGPFRQRASRVYPDSPM